MSGRTTPPPGHDGGAARPAVTVCRGCCCPPPRPASPAGTRRLISPCTAGVFCVEDWAGYLAFACRACAVERPAVPGALS
jgi:hypothetical protein